MRTLSLFLLLVGRAALAGDASMPAAPNGHSSDLWGTAGETWSPHGRLPDFSCAGYHEGELAIPDMPVKASVKDFGAKGDGVADDTAAFKRAIAGVTNGAIAIPKGRYLIGHSWSGRTARGSQYGSGWDPISFGLPN